MDIVDPSDQTSSPHSSPIATTLDQSCFWALLSSDRFGILQISPSLQQQLNKHGLTSSDVLSRTFLDLFDPLEHEAIHTDLNGFHIIHKQLQACVFRWRLLDFSFLKDPNPPSPQHLKSIRSPTQPYFIDSDVTLVSLIDYVLVLVHCKDACIDSCPASPSELQADFAAIGEALSPSYKCPRSLQIYNIHDLSLVAAFPNDYLTTMIGFDFDSHTSKGMDFFSEFMHSGDYFGFKDTLEQSSKSPPRKPGQICSHKLFHFRYRFRSTASGVSPDVLIPVNGLFLFYHNFLFAISDIEHPSKSNDSTSPSTSLPTKVSPTTNSVPLLSHRRLDQIRRAGSHSVSSEQVLVPAAVPNADAVISMPSLRVSSRSSILSRQSTAIAASVDSLQSTVPFHHRHPVIYSNYNYSGDSNLTRRDPSYAGSHDTSGSVTNRLTVPSVRHDLNTSSQTDPFRGALRSPVPSHSGQVFNASPVSNPPYPPSSSSSHGNVTASMSQYVHAQYPVHPSVSYPYHPPVSNLQSSQPHPPLLPQGMHPSSVFPYPSAPAPPLYQPYGGTTGAYPLHPFSHPPIYHSPPSSGYARHPYFYAPYPTSGGVPGTKVSSQERIDPGGTSSKKSSSKPERLNLLGLTRKKASVQRKCENCGTTDSPEWRRGPNGHKTLCNACGLRYARILNKRKEIPKLRLDLAESITGNSSRSPGLHSTTGSNDSMGSIRGNMQDVGVSDSGTPPSTGTGGTTAAIENSPTTTATNATTQAE